MSSASHPPAADTGRTATPAAPARTTRPTLNEAVEALVALAHNVNSPQALLREALSTIAQVLGAPVGALEVRWLSNVSSETFAESDTQRAFWANTLQGALETALSNGQPKARMYTSKRDGTTLALLNAPLRGPEGRVTGAAVFVAPCPDRASAAQLLDILTSLSFLTATLLESIGDMRASREQAGSDALSSLRKVANFESTTELAFALTNKLRTRDGCDTVALAQVIGTRVQLLAISGLDEVSSKSPGVRCIQAALEECFDLGRPIVQQDSGDFCGSDVVLGSPLHERWRTSAKGAPVASLPLRVEGQVVAVLGVRRAPHSTFSAADLEDFEKLVAPYAATLELVERASRSLFRHFQTAASRLTRDVCSRGQLGLKAAILGPLLLALWLAFGSLEYELTVPCTILPTEARQVGTPQDGVLAHIWAHPGDRVRAGDLLCQFDVSELELERERLLGEREILEVEEGRAMAANEPAEIQLARANRANVQASLDLAEHRISSAFVRAPADGIVASGDLRPRLGDVFTKGEALFEVATAKGWSLDLRVPEDEVTDVENGMIGRFSSHARPEASHRLTIRTVRPHAESIEGQNVYIARADVSLDVDWIRAGMEGLAVVEIDERAPWRVLFHGVEDWLRLHIWL